MIKEEKEEGRKGERERKRKILVIRNWLTRLWRLKDTTTCHLEPQEGSEVISVQRQAAFDPAQQACKKQKDCVRPPFTIFVPIGLSTDWLRPLLF